MFRKCAWCQKDLGEIEPLDDKRVTHGICGPCSISEMEKFEKYMSKMEIKADPE